MTTPVFTWTPAPDVTGTTAYQILSAQFGDGYSQAAGDGINTAADTWPLTFVKPVAIISAIKAFLDATGGYQSFYWTPPMRAQGLFRATAPAVQPHGAGVATLTVTFTEVFNP